MPEFIVTTDSSDQPYVEFALGRGGDRLRVTRRYVAPHGDVVRIQLREERSLTGGNLAGFELRHFTLR